VWPWQQWVHTVAAIRGLTRTHLKCLLDAQSDRLDMAHKKLSEAAENAAAVERDNVVKLKPS
jgi:hypothetical protein